MHTPLYLDTPSTVDAFLASIARTPILALDTEGASFHRFVDRIYLLQLSTREHTAILDPIPIGKPQGSDAARNKPTYPNLLGLEGAKAVAERLYKDAIGAIEILGAQGENLRAMADYIVRRDR